MRHPKATLFTALFQGGSGKCIRKMGQLGPRILRLSLDLTLDQNDWNSHIPRWWKNKEIAGLMAAI